MTELARDDRTILLERARALAVPPRTATGETLDVVEFRLARESYAVSTRHVSAALALQEFTPLPRRRSPIVGLIEWRGALLTLLDPRQALGLSTAALNDLRHVLVIGDDEQRVGILVDTIIGTRSFPVDAVQPAPEQGRLAIGVTADALTVLDGSALARLHK